MVHGHLLQKNGEANLNLVHMKNIDCTNVKDLTFEKWKEEQKQWKQ